VADRLRVTVRDARHDDWEAMWPFFRQIVAAGESYAHDRHASISLMRDYLRPSVARRQRQVQPNRRLASDEIARLSAGQG